MKTALSHTEVPSPLGPLTLLASANGLTAVLFHAPPEREREGWRPADERVADARAQLEEYFTGRRRTFALPLDLHGTPFQLRVWQTLRNIPYGETISYAELARRIGNPAAVRAVGSANARNPVSIIIPCHRVIGSSGGLVGYGGGLERKRFLLQLEGATKFRSSIAP